MVEVFSRQLFVSLIVFALTCGGSFAQEKINYPILDTLEIQTIVYQVELYREFKIVIDDAVEREEQRLKKEALNWDTSQWDLFIDQIVEKKIILAFDESNASADKITFMQSLKNKTTKAMKSVVRSLTTMGRIDGVGTIIAYLGGSAAGYAMVGVGMVVGSAQMVSFFSVFPVATVTVSAVLVVNSITDKMKMKKAFNEDEDFDYYNEYKKISKKIKKQLRLNKGDLIYTINEQNGFIIRKKGLISDFLSLFGVNKDKLSLRFLIKMLKKEKLYSEQIKQLRKSKQLGYVEKIVLIIEYIENNFDEESKNKILSRLARQRVFDLPLLEKLKDIVIWGIEATQINELALLPQVLNKAPRGIPFITITKVYQDYIIPKIAKTIKGRKFQKFKCLREGFFKQTAVGYKNIKLQWLAESEEVSKMIMEIEACIN